MEDSILSMLIDYKYSLSMLHVEKSFIKFFLVDSSLILDSELPTEKSKFENIENEHIQLHNLYEAFNNDGGKT